MNGFLRYVYKIGKILIKKNTLKNIYIILLITLCEVLNLIKSGFVRSLLIEMQS